MQFLLPIQHVKTRDSFEDFNIPHLKTRDSFEDMTPWGALSVRTRDAFEDALPECHSRRFYLPSPSEASGLVEAGEPQDKPAHTALESTPRKIRVRNTFVHFSDDDVTPGPHNGRRARTLTVPARMFAETLAGEEDSTGTWQAPLRVEPGAQQAAQSPPVGSPGKIMMDWARPPAAELAAAAASAAAAAADAAMGPARPVHGLGQLPTPGLDCPADMHGLSNSWPVQPLGMCTQLAPAAQLLLWQAAAVQAVQVSAPMAKPQSGQMPEAPKQEARKPRGKKADARKPDAGQIPAAGRTTVVLQNLPLNYRRAMLAKMLDAAGFAGAYDFIYLPMDFKTRAGFGYAFVNLVDPSVVPRFWQTFEGYNKWVFPCNKVCHVGWSEPHQGIKAHIRRFRNSPLMHESVPDEYRPALFSGGIRVPFPAPTKVLQPPSQEMKGAKPSRRRGSA